MVSISESQTIQQPTTSSPTYIIMHRFPSHPLGSSLLCLHMHDQVNWLPISIGDIWLFLLSYRTRIHIRLFGKTQCSHSDYLCEYYNTTLLFVLGTRLTYWEVDRQLIQQCIPPQMYTSSVLKVVHVSEPKRKTAKLSLFLLRGTTLVDNIQRIWKTTSKKQKSWEYGVGGAHIWQLTMLKSKWLWNLTRVQTFIPMINWNWKF